MQDTESPEKKSQESYADWERPIFEAWKDKGYFGRTPGRGKHADVPFTMVIPPPNVTGVLHMGHALNDSIQDAVTRRARMQGRPTRWILGTDHAGIATQTKVDKHLAEMGINRREIGREAFIEECQKWRDEYGGIIVRQIQAMGCSCDYDDEQFTMSPEFSLAVRKVFVDWYKAGIVYKGKRIVNWCPHCTTAISDDEAEYEPEKGHLWYIKYPLKEPVGGVDHLVVATTRPETMLGDTGVAVSPKDDRYAELVDAKVVLPIVGREIPVFTDFHVDPEFGTGAVKVTPAHDPNDYAMGQAHDLESINIFDEHAVVVDGFGKFSGMDRDEAREAVVAELESLGLLLKVEDLEHSVMHCYRCHNTLEPWLSDQWFVSVGQLKDKASAALAKGKIQFHPARWEQVCADWFESLKDWCISRQLWWGHRIPMYYCDSCGWQDASVDEIEICPNCGSHTRQDDDVLDTWFSSQLWPFATQGWGEEGKDALELTSYYPTQVLSTARDIMGLWVARMIMASEWFMDEIPFEHVIIHPTVIGSDGKPMSKSRGNGVDPLELMEKFGADGMRFGLLSQVTGSQAIRFDEKRIEGARNFANKVRNSARFVMMNLDGYEPGDPSIGTLADRWIFSRLANCVQALNDSLDEFEFAEAASTLQAFVWNELCDWYLEFSKSRMTGEASHEDSLACKRNLVYLLNVVLRLLHPFMPFLTERVNAELNGSDAQMLIVSEWPESEDFARFEDAEAEAEIGYVTSIVGAIRSARARYGISPKEQLRASIRAEGEAREAIIRQSRLIESLAKVDEIEVSADMERPPKSVTGIAQGAEVYVIMGDLVDFDKERARLSKGIEKLKKDHDKFQKKLSNPGFLASAAEEVIEKDKAKLSSISEELSLMEAELARLQ